MSDIEPERCFVDTNVWLYAFLQNQDQDKTVRAKAVIQSGDVVVSSQVINEVCVNLIKKARFDEINIRRVIESFYGKYRVAEISRTCLMKASEPRDGYSFSCWDSLIVACALLEEASMVYSEDLHSGLIVESRLQIINPF